MLDPWTHKCFFEKFPIVVSLSVHWSSLYTACLMKDVKFNKIIIIINCCCVHSVTNAALQSPNFLPKFPELKEAGAVRPCLAHTCPSASWVSRPSSSRSLIMKNQLPRSPLNSHVRRVPSSTNSLHGIHGSKVYNGNYPSMTCSQIWRSPHVLIINPHTSQSWNKTNPGQNRWWTQLGIEIWINQWGIIACTQWTQFFFFLLGSLGDWNFVVPNVFSPSSPCVPNRFLHMFQ